jgi:hypothetical protein
VRNVSTRGLITLAIALASAGAPAFGQEAPAPAPAPAPAAPAVEEPPVSDTANEIVVIADSLRGQVEAPEPPLLELKAEDIAAYGAGSVSELLDALSSVTGSGRGRGGGGPAILVNGVRIANFREIASYPPEAIEKVEVLPEEVALRYGFSADQRVVNFVLKRNYSNRNVELSYGQPWRGGYSTESAEGTYLRLAGQGRLNFNGRFSTTSGLTEFDRGVIQSSIPLAGDPDPALYRSLVGKSSNGQITGNYSTKLGTSGTSVSVNGQYQRSDSTRLQGIDTVLLVGPDPDGLGPLPAPTQLRSLNAVDPLRVMTRSNTYSGGGVLNTSLGDWQLVATVDGSHTDSRSLIDKRADTSVLLAAAKAGTLSLTGPIADTPDAGRDQAITHNDSATSKVTLSGRPILLPGGNVSMTADGGYDWTQIRSRDTRNANTPITLVRGDLNAGLNVGVPITSRREDFGAGFGDLNLNLTGGIDHLSDFGTLYDWTVGLTWSPLKLENLTLQVSRIGRDVAPSLAQLGNPQINTFNVPVFDLTRNETVLATTISGGNPNLPAQKQNDWKFGLNWQLPQFSPAIQRANLTIEYFKNHSDNVISGFPVLTPTIEAAFPGRVVRDAAGHIVSIDQRAVTFASQDVERLQIGFNINGPFGKALPPERRQQDNNPLRQAFGALRGGQQGGAPQIAQGNGQPGQGGPGGPGGGQGGQGGQGQGGFRQGGGNFNPQVFQDLRTKWCAPDAANKVPTAADLAGLPEQITTRLKKPDGTIDPAQWAELRTRVCNGGQGGGNFNPPAFQRLRQQFCTDANANTLPTAEQLAGLPEQLTSRLKKPDGTIDAALWKVFRDRICSANGPGQGGGGQRGQGGQGGPGGGDGGPQFIFRGPGDGGPPPPGGGGQTVIIGPGGGNFNGGGGGGGGGFRGGPGGGGGGGFGGGGGGDGRGRFFANLNFVHEFKDTVLIAPGIPVLDLLNGDAVTGGQPRNTVNLNGGLFYRGFGSQFQIRYTGESRINGNGTAGSTNLFFDDYTVVGFRLFADLNQQTKLIRDVPLLKNTRITLGVNNVFDTRQRIVDSTGITPLRYQPFLVDAVGRFIQFQVRKQF